MFFFKTVLSDEGRADKKKENALLTAAAAAAVVINLRATVTSGWGAAATVWAVVGSNQG